MKRILMPILFLLGLNLWSQSSEERFTMANGLYKDGEFNKAIELYLSIENEGLESSDLYFNLGNCYYKLNKVAPSIYYFEKAIKIDPLHEDAHFNLAFAKRMTIDLIEELPKTFLQRFSEGVIQKLHYDTWAIIAVIASFLASLLFLLYHFSVSSRKKLFYFNTTIFAGFILVVSIFFAFNNYETVKKDRTAIIFSLKTSVKNAPSKSSEPVFELHEGTKVVILDELDDWKKIKIADGKTGWMQADDLKEI